MNITYTFLKIREKHHVLFCQDNVTLCNPFSFFSLTWSVKRITGIVLLIVQFNNTMKWQYFRK